MFNRKKTSLTLLTGVLASGGLLALTSCGTEEKGIYEASNEMAAFRALTYMADTLKDDEGNSYEHFKMLSGNATVVDLAGDGVLNMAYQYSFEGSIVTNYQSFTITNYGILADGQDASEVISAPITVEAEACEDVESSMSTYIHVSLVNAVYEEYLETGAVHIRRDQDSMLAYTYDEEKLEAYVYAGEDLNKSRATVEIPSTISYKNKNYRVVGIAKDGFYNCRTLVSITIPSSITSIGDFAFGGCLSLNEVHFASDSALTSIPYGAFYGCNSLETITLPSSIQNIGDWAFGEARALQEVVMSSKGQLRTLGTYAFYSCTSLTTLDISNVKQISEYAFANCSSLRFVSSSDELESIGRYAFHGCESLKFCYLPNSVASIRSDAFTGCTQLIIVSESAENATNVASWSKNWNVNEEYVYWGVAKTALVLEQGAYYYLDNQKAKLICYLGTETEIHVLAEIIKDDVHYPVTAIGYAAFKNATKLTKITFDSTSQLETIETSAFENCRALQELRLPNTLVRIDDKAFSSCSGLKAIMLFSSITHMGADLFHGCNGLVIYSSLPEASLEWDETWNAAGRPIYWNCSSDTFLETVSNEQVTMRFVIQDQQAVLTQYVAKERNVTIPSEVEIGSVTYPVTSIGAYAFYGNSSIYTVVIPSSIVHISANAFSECLFLNIFCEVSEPLEGWEEDWVSSRIRVYYDGKWKYDEKGVPVPTSLV